MHLVLKFRQKKILKQANSLASGKQLFQCIPLTYSLLKTNKLGFEIIFDWLVDNGVR